MIRIKYTGQIVTDEMVLWMKQHLLDMHYEDGFYYFHDHNADLVITFRLKFGF